MRYEDDSLTGLESHQRGGKPGGGKPGGAIYHLTVRTGSRSKGNSARASAAYIERAEEYSLEPDAAAELVYTESGHMPEWADAEAGGVAYWDAADLYERNNGRLYKSVEIALPLALDADQQRELAVGFAHHLTDAEQLPYTLAIHAGKGENPHCHLMISERTNDDIERSPATWFKRYNAAEPEAGGAQKSTALKPKDWLLETRAVWAEQTNQALELAGHEIRIDHRSLEAQGIDRSAGIHLGPVAAALERRGIQSERGNIQAAIEAANELHQTRIREKGIEEHGIDRQIESQPSPTPNPRPAPTPELEPDTRTAARRDHGIADRDRAVADRAAELTPPADGLAGGAHPPPRGVVPDGATAGRGASGKRGRGVETGEGRGERLYEPGDRRGPGLRDPARLALERAISARTGAVFRPELAAAAGVGRGVGGRRSRGADLHRDRPRERGHSGVEQSAGDSYDLSPAMGHGNGGGAKGNREASSRQDAPAVNAAAVAAAVAQLAAAEAAVHQAEQQAAQQREWAVQHLEQRAAQKQAKEKALEQKLEKARALAAVPAREATAKAARAVPEQQRPGWSVEKVAQDKALAAEISQIEDPQIRAKAERLLSGIKQQAEARQPRKELERGKGEGPELELGD